MKKETTSQRLATIMKLDRLRQVDVLERCKPYCEEYGINLRKNDLSQYVSGKVKPGQEKLTILALGLGVSESWLMGYDVELNQNLSKFSSKLNENEQIALSLFNELSVLNKGIIIGNMQMMITNQKESK